MGIKVLQRHRRAARAVLRQWAAQARKATGWTSASRRARVLASGVDTLELWSTKALTPAGLALVQAAQRAAVEGGQPVGVVVGPLELRASPRWRNTALLESDLYAVKVEPDAASTGATVRVEVRALALWAQGWEAAAARAVDAMAALCGADGLEVQVGRVDVCVDWQGWVPTPEERHRFTCRARKRGRYFEDGHLQLDDADWCQREAKRIQALAKKLAAARGPERRELLELIHKRPLPHREAEYDAGRHFTGLTFGIGAPCAARMYDKTREIITSHKGWFRRVWQGYDDSRPVWRLEFQLRREALRSFRLSREGYTEDLSTWERLKPRLGALWRYLTHSWLRHGGRTSATRQVLSAAWASLADGWVGAAAPVEGLHRAALEGAAQPVTAAVAGYLTTAAAQLAELGHPAAASGDFGRTIAAVLRAAWDYTEKKHGPPEKRAQAKRATLAARRRQLEAHQRAQAAEAFALRARPRGHVERSRGILYGADGRPVRLVGPEGAVYVKRDAAQDAREATAATLRAWQELEGLRHESDSLDWKWCVAELE